MINLTECSVDYLNKWLLNRQNFPIPQDYRGDYWLYLIECLTVASQETRTHYLNAAIESLLTAQDEELVTRLFAVLSEVGNENLEKLTTISDKVVEWLDYTKTMIDKYDMRREILFLLGRCLLPTKDWATLIEAGLTDSNYVVATYMALEHQYPKKYAERLPEVLKLMEENNMPTQWFLFALKERNK